jgi:pimeloyl-ACP methyl ester carboxylesterase
VGRETERSSSGATSRAAATEGRPGSLRLLLLHGLGTTGAVWRPLIAQAERTWSGPILAPDLSGHGHADGAPPYAFGRYAAEVAGLLVDGDGEVVPTFVVGHSMGGVVALALASGWFGRGVVAAVGLGIKVRWTDEELGRAAALARRPARVFATPEEARERYLLVTGLTGLISPADDVAADGVVTCSGGWRLAHDPASFLVGAPDLPGLLGAARAPVTLAAGERDAMSTGDDLRALTSAVEILPGLGHNAHVEAPAVVLDLVRRVVAGVGLPAGEVPDVVR